MKYIVVFISLFLLCSTLALAGDRAKSNTIDQDIIITGSEDSIIVAFFKKTLEIETAKIATQFRTETLKKSQDDFWKLAKYPNLKSSRHYKFTETKDKDSFITVDCFVMKNRLSTTDAIDNYCDIDREAIQKGVKKKSDLPSAKKNIPFRTFCVNDIIFVLNASPKSLDLLTNVFQPFSEALQVEDLDVVPSQRNYIEERIAWELEPAIELWLDYYKLDITRFVGVSFNEPDDQHDIDHLETDSTSRFFIRYKKKDLDIYDPVLYDYSPNKKYYINLLPAAGAYLDKDGEYYYYNADHPQEIYLVNREKEKIALVKWLSSSTLADAAFWLGNETCIIVGRTDYDPNTFFVECFGKISGYYEFRAGARASNETYLIRNIKDKGIRIEN